jgi:hypothetical protein
LVILDVVNDGTSDQELEAEFHRLMIAGAHRLQREIGYNPTRFQQMVADHGGVEAARRVVNGPDASDGFTTLWETGKLTLSVEAHVLLPRFHALFTDQERRLARTRLERYDFDVQPFLDNLGDRLP